MKVSTNYENSFSINSRVKTFQKTKTKTEKSNATPIYTIFFTIEQVSIDFYTDSPLTGNTILLQIIDNLTPKKKKKKTNVQIEQRPK